MIRGSLLYLSEQKWLRHWMETSPLSKRLTSRFVAGSTLEDGIQVLRELSRENILGTLDCLGENVATEQDAQHSRDGYLEALKQIAAISVPATVSIKLTQFGLDLSSTVCFDNVSVLVACAVKMGTRVEIDMESSAYTDRTIELASKLQAKFPGHVRSVIQAYLFRSETDIKHLSSLGIPIRLCKGAYREPPNLAFPLKADVDANYVRLMKLMFAEGIERLSQVTMRRSSGRRYVIAGNKILRRIVLNFRCSMESGGTCNVNSSRRDCGFGSTFRMGTPGTPISCGDWRSGRPTYFSSPRISFAHKSRAPRNPAVFIGV